jgi:hypothetical protein
MKILASGLFGAGKTFFSLGFPKVYYVGVEPQGLEILRAPDAKHLVDTLAGTTSRSLSRNGLENSTRHSNALVSWLRKAQSTRWSWTT